MRIQNHYTLFIGSARASIDHSYVFGCTKGIAWLSLGTGAGKNSILCKKVEESLCSSERVGKEKSREGKGSEKTIEKRAELHDRYLRGT